jgi:hypothetical protein
MDGPPQEQIDLTPEQIMVNRLATRIAQLVVSAEAQDMRLEAAYNFIRQLGYDPMTGEPLDGEPSTSLQS